MKWKAIFFLVFGLLVINPPVHAAPWTDTFDNPVATDQIFLFMVDGGVDNVTFQGWAQEPYTDGWFGWGWLGAHSWTSDIDQEDVLSASGNDFGTNPFWDLGHFNVNFSDDQNDFTMEYAYLLDGGIVEAGTRIWDAGTSTWTLTSDFTSTIPNPIGGTAWLLASGLLAVVSVRRRRQSTPK